MIKSACDVMKKSILLSATLLVVGVILEIIAQFLSFETIFPVIFTYGGFLAISLGVLIVLVTFAAIMVPKINQHLDACQH